MALKAVLPELPGEALLATLSLGVAINNPDMLMCMSHDHRPLAQASKPVPPFLI